MKKILSIFTLIITIHSNAQEIKFGKVSKEELQEKFHPLDSTNDAAYLLKKRRTYFQYDTNKGFQVVTDYHERIKIYSKEGFNYATKKIKYYKPEHGDEESINSLKAYTFNLENNEIVKQKTSRKDIFDEQLNKYRSQKKITFPNVKEGSVIDIKYTLISPFWNIKTLNFQYGIPVKSLNYKVEIPEYFTFNKTSKGFFSIPLKESSKRGKVNFGYNNNVDYKVFTYIFNQKNIPPIKNNEPYSGNINNYRGGIEFELSGTRFPNSTYKNYATTWEDVCKTIYKSSSFGTELNRTNYYEKDIKDLLSPAKNDLEKIAIILEYVKSKVKWNGYYGKYTDKGVKKAYKEGVGNSADINLILTSILRYSGLKANPVLISTKNNGIPLFPTLDGFNYVISKVNLTNENYVLLDATEKFSSVNILPYRSLNWYGREVFEKGYSEKVNLHPSSHSKENNILHVKIDNLGEINGMLRKTLSGHSAMFYRQKNNIKKEEDVITNTEETHNIEIENFKVFNAKDVNKSLTQTIKFTSEDFVEQINEKLYFSPLFFLATKENPFKSKERNFPIDFSMPWQDQFSISITIPEGYTIESYPEDIAIGLPDNLGVFIYKVLIQNNKIKLSSTVQFNSNIIAPQYYAIVKSFYNQLVEKQTERIVLAKKMTKS
ncbi:Transglutaminase-like superfamily protein [Tenacibaculum mesophilum]|uniref:DUF3857 domain-containing protein n=1 Tax=Tenacibaculum mesophilum TaxID=104268 RepID=A0ABN5T5T2_9FLAO|nr:DUF3857 domain-containing protein [Tenacibaculum mesophilum]AZJ32673.1 DUF3857 domain-containing protein [Tenacibaculum mesophilum]QFS27924.1 DUF3857 domain-containing protein [Tenacibaculum mesophilum]SHF76854.1 Transglutaminase-like superfamily protein [Tenacibaculum mesophilum]